MRLAFYDLANAFMNIWIINAAFPNLAINAIMHISFLYMVPGAGLEPARMLSPRDFKSLASTNFATRAFYLRLESESNRRPRLCRPLHNHSATQP